MSQTDPSEGSEDVTDFLRRIKELGDKRDREDAERARKLEEEILEGRRQREARRAERARSLSPEKQSPSGTLRSPRLPPSRLQHDSPNSPSAPVSDQRESRAREDVLRSTRGPSKMRSVDSPIPPPTDSPDSSTISTAEESTTQSTTVTSVVETPIRSSTLSWQQRPGSRNTVRSRPISMVERASSPLAQSQPRSYRDNKDESEIGAGAASVDRPLPGTFKNIAKDMDHKHAHVRSPTKMSGDLLSDTPGVTDEILDGKARLASSSSDSSSPLPMRDSQRFPPPETQSSPVPQDAYASNLSALSPSLTQPHPGNGSRPISPTKGMGSFVQSAMKRSDSVNKRWSVQTTSGLNRQDSVAGIRNSSRLSQDLTNGRDRSIGSIRRFGAPIQEVDNNNTQDNVNRSPSTPPHQDEDLKTTTAAARTPQHQRSIPALSDRSDKEGKDDEVHSPPSPSKRWSPVKSSWLESALSRPTSPQLAANSAQPGWLSDLNKSKQQRTSQDITPTRQSQDVVIQPVLKTTKSMPFDTKGALSSSTSLKSPPTKPKPVSIFNKTSGEANAENDVTRSRDVGLSSGLTLGNIASSPSVEDRTKPMVPTKTDFRSALKPLEASTEPAEKDELEFRNVFGKLKRTHTGKYNPPDELKDNILRGKAALTANEEPQPTIRRDEFKDDLLKQRETMTTNRAGISTPMLPDKKPFRPVSSVDQDSQGSSISRRGVSGDDNQESSLRSSKDDHSEESIRRPLFQSNAPINSSVVQNESITNSKIAARFNPDLINALAKRATAGGDSTHSPAAAIRIQKGANEDSSDVAVDAEGNKAGQLQHMTKGRARGPKRRLPKASGGTSDDQGASNATVKMKPTLPKRIASNHTVASMESSVIAVRTVSETRAKPQTPPKSASIARSSVSPQTSEANVSPSASRSSRSPSLPSRPIKPSGLRNPSGLAPETPTAKSERVSSGETAGVEDVEDTAMSVKDATARWGRRTTSRSTDATEVKAPIKLPTLKDEQADLASATLSGVEEKTDATSTKISPVPQSSTTSQDLKYTKSLRAPPKVGAKSAAATRSISSSLMSNDRPPSKPPRATPSQTQTSSRFLSDFFNVAPKISGPLDIDIQNFLYTGPSNSDNIKTLRKTISQISSDGKTAPLPSYQDHILFDRSMYLCTHIFGDSSGARTTEVYLWAGTSVTDATLEETQIYARKVAKDAGGKLIIFRQGKETSNFLQALGGILITRSGLTSNNKKSYMLCGRRHLGHIAFDEVDFSLSSLSPGFPFIIASSSDMIYVWKGCGCNAEELAGARLMSMDLGVSSKVVEIDEGAETPDFLAIFPRDSAASSPATYWKLKANNLSYNVRLFRIEHNDNPMQDTSAVTALWNRVRQPDIPTSAAPSKQSRALITEISPFCQSDIEPENIYVLDAFFELFVYIFPKILPPPPRFPHIYPEQNTKLTHTSITGPLATSKPHAYTTALLFAQDYAIQSASNSLENRPFVPGCTVVLQGVPGEMKAVFRGWRAEREGGTELLMAGRQRGEGDGVRRVGLGLGEAIGACR